MIHDLSDLSQYIEIDCSLSHCRCGYPVKMEALVYLVAEADWSEWSILVVILCEPDSDDDCSTRIIQRCLQLLKRLSLSVQAKVWTWVHGYEAVWFPFLTLTRIYHCSTNGLWSCAYHSFYTRRLLFMAVPALLHFRQNVNWNRRVVVLYLQSYTKRDSGMQRTFIYSTPMTIIDHRPGRHLKVFLFKKPTASAAVVCCEHVYTRHPW